MSTTPSPSLLQRISNLFKGSTTTRPGTERFADGRADSEVEPAALKASVLKVLASQAKRAPENLQLLLETLALKAQGGYDDDSKYVVHSLSVIHSEGRWNILFNLLLRCHLVPQFKRNLPIRLFVTFGMFFVIRLCRILAMTFNTGLPMAVTM
jgi:hypothetical protein